MKILTIGDVHGSGYWKELIDLGKYDKIVFLGDYVDSFTETDGDILSNLNQIIELKKQNRDRIILLWGNHDLQYRFSYSTHGCSGYRYRMYAALHTLFTENDYLFQASFQIGNYIWTHAGINNRWFDWFEEHAVNLTGTISEKLNDMFNSSKEYVLSAVGRERGGNSNYGGIFWADKSETSAYPLEGTHQIVGHTRVYGITEMTFDENTSIVYCDCLQSLTKGHELEIDE